jgi:hypothetical protein
MNSAPGLFCLLALTGLAGCSSPDSKYPYNGLRFSEVRQSPSGQLALIYHTAPERTPGERVFLVDETTLTRNIITAVNDLREKPGYGETFAGGLILHRNLSLTQPGTEKYWVELDPFALTGTWVPSLDKAALPPGTAAATLPASFNAPQTVVLGNENFLWQTVEGPFDTSVSRQPLFQPNRRDTLTGKTEAALGATTIVVGTAAVVGTVFTLEYLCHSPFDLSYPCPPQPPFPSHPYY